MKITEILVESQQLDEGPLGNLVKAAGRGIGKLAGGAAKAAGAVAGGIAGMGSAAKKGFAAGKAVTSGDEEPEDTSTAPAASSALSPAPAAAPTSQEINKAGPAGAPQAKPVQGAVAKQAVAKTAQATAGQDATQAGQTMYAQVKANIDKLDKKGKQRILQLLQKSLAAAPAKEPAAQPAAQPAAPAAQPSQQPAANNTTATPAAGSGAEQPATAAGKKKPTPKKKVAPSQAEIDADRERIMGVTSDSIIRKQPVIAEGFTLFKR